METNYIEIRNLNQNLSTANRGKKGVIEMKLSKTISSPDYEVGKYYYKIKKQKSKSKSSCYFVQTELAENTSSKRRMILYENFIDDSDTYVVIKFYLPEPANAELILMDSDKRDALCFINGRLEAGAHIFKTEIRMEELSRFSYYYKLNANGASEVRKMKYVKSS